MSKRLTANDIANIAKQEFSYKEILIKANTGHEFTVKIQEKLNESKLAELVSELTIKSNEFSKLNLDFDMILNIYILIIKYFTDIKFNNYKSLIKQVEYECKVLKNLIDLNLLDQILNSFDEDCIKDIEKLFDKYPKHMSQITENIAMKEVVDSADI